MTLPSTIADFFRMKNAHEHGELRTLFAPDAVIIDGGEGTQMRGTDEIKKWIKTAVSDLNTPRFGNVRSALANGASIR